MKLPIKVFVSDHALLRFRQRCREAYASAEHKFHNSAWCIARISQHYWGGDLLDVAYPPLRPWLARINLADGEFLSWNSRTRIILICKQVGRTVIVKTVFRAVCRQCHRVECVHLRIPKLPSAKVGKDAAS